MRKYFNRKNKIFTMGMILTLFFAFLVIFANNITPYDPVKMEISNKFIKPCIEHPFGTDHMGRDVLSRVIYGSRVSLVTAASAVLISAFLGTLLGMISGYIGGIVDVLLMRLVDVMLAFPAIVFALAISTLLGKGQTNLLIAICFVQWTRYARVVRGEVIMFKTSEYIQAARSIGNSRIGVLIRYVLPYVIPKIIILISLDIGSIILYCASLSFLGLGAQPPSPDWGVMISEGKDYMRYAPWMTIFPGLSIAFSALAFNLLGDGLRDLLDPRMNETVRTE
ncbi:MAG: nickel transporter permease [Lachnospiraceae bacterium]|nr:nickel transporter permease [Lachnospiraceae bacterium]